MLIDSDAVAAALAAVGNDSSCADRCSEIAPKTVVETRLSRLGILSLYADPAAGATVLGAIDAVAADNPIVAEIRSFMGAGVHPSCLPDWSLPSIRAALTAPIEAGGLGLTAELAAPILAASERPQTITVDEVSAAMRDSRENA